MRVYFEDDVLTELEDFDKDSYYKIDATLGPSYCFQELYWHRKYDPETIIYTNFLNALSFDFSWDEKENKCAAYIRNDKGVWTNIQDLTDRELRFAHNIPKMYIAGEFKEMFY